jgi:hypothetical protein
MKPGDVEIGSTLSTEVRQPEELVRFAWRKTAG